MFVRLTLLMCGLFWAASLFGAEPGEETAELFKSYGVQIPDQAPDRRTGEGNGPFPRLVIDGAMLVDGLGSPPRGPVSIVIEEDRISSIHDSAPKSVPGEERIDATGMTALPGFIDAHAHAGYPGQGLGGPVTPPEYVFKLWLAHGITTVLDVGSIMGLGWTVEHARRSESNSIVAPRIIPYAIFPGTIITDADAAKVWVRAVKKKGALGVKLRGGTKEALTAVYEETARLQMGTAKHHDQNGVYHMNVLDSARLGLDSMEHWYGLPEAMFTDRTIQDYPPDYNYSDEQWRFGEAGNLWLQAAPPGSDTWKATIRELQELDFTLVPTFTIYEANRDVMRARRAEWHDEYTWPALEKFFQPDPRLHGSYHFDWTTSYEVAWRNNFARWMQFVNNYKNAGGRVAAGSDAGFIFKLYGFAYIRELELLQEAGFHPLEVIQAATLNGAELLGMDDQIGAITNGRQADLVLVKGNPVANLKLLYGTGHMYLDREAGEVTRVGGVSHVVKSGVVYDAKQLLDDVRAMVREARDAEESETVNAVLETTLGDIEVEVFVDQAPHSAGSFLEFLDSGRYKDGGFYRVVRPDNDNGDPAISVIQGGLLDTTELQAEDLVPHETTDQTGIKHTDGVLSLARRDPGTGSGGIFFICVGDQPSLDYGGKRNEDGQGFASFGRVVSGMEVVRKINAIKETRAVDDPYMRNQILVEPVVIKNAYRKDD